MRSSFNILFDYMEQKQISATAWVNKHLGTVLFCLTDSADGAAGQTGRTVPECLPGV